jgi:hypothetical protein
MKKITAFSIILILFAKFAFPQVETKRTIEDYYYLLNWDVFFEWTLRGNDSKEYRKSIIKIMDIDNGYIETTDDILMSLYYDSINKRDIVALSYACEGCFNALFEFRTYTENGTWEKLDIYPKKEMESYMEELNKYSSGGLIEDCRLSNGGTTITAVDLETRVKLFDLKWDGQKFNLVKTRNIEDYYLLLPLDFFNCDSVNYIDSKQARVSIERVKDSKNGYIEAHTSKGSLYIDLYKNKIQNRDIIAVSLDCGPDCKCSILKFIEYNENGTWTDVDIVPYESIKSYINELSEKAGNKIIPSYILPQKGTTIVANNYFSKQKLFDLKWDGQKFSLVKPQ